MGEHNNSEAIVIINLEEIDIGRDEEEKNYGIDNG